MSERTRRRLPAWRRVLGGVVRALDSIPDGVATALGLALGLAVVIAGAWGGWVWVWLSVVTLGLALLVGSKVGARTRAEGWLSPAVGSAAMLGLAAGILGLALVGRDEVEAEVVVVVGVGEPMRLDLGGGGDGGTSTGGSEDTGSGASTATTTSGTTGSSSSSGGGMDGDSTGEVVSPPRPKPEPPTDETSSSSSGGSTTDDGDIDVVAMNLPFCRSGTFIEGGSFDGHVIKDLCMDTTEVTASSYQRCVDKGICEAARTGGNCNAEVEGRGKHPINCVDWDQAKKYCESFAGKRLPNQWEWEWAARGRDKGWTYPWGEEAPTCERVVMNGEGDWGCGKDRTWAVGSKRKGNSRDGLKDMAGNVREWTSSQSGGRRIVRGGSWFSSNPDNFRASNRNDNNPTNRYILIGFRCARTSSSSQ